MITLLRRCAAPRFLRLLLAATNVWLATFASLAIAESITRAPYLLLGTPTSIQVRWKTDTPSTGRIYYGLNPWKLTTFVDEGSSATDHIVNLTSLTPDARYYYSVGNNTATTLASGLTHKFVTSPPANVGKPTRIWVIGDAGTGNANQSAVRDAFVSYNGTRETDLWLVLGDNAYGVGAEAEYDANHFGQYRNQLRNTVSWYTLGNHETYTGTVGNHPYFNVLSFPTAAEAGGVPSGTKNYFSFNYGDIHFISLDSMESSRAVGGPMYTWLATDLAANTRTWLIAYWHHPAYTKGTHDSDNASGNDPELKEMRENMVPLLEANGVDLVLAGHSHVYERSYLIDGHYGLSSTFVNAMKVNAGDGKPAGDGAYTKGSLGAAAHQGAVYVTAGSSGQIGGFGFGTHPAMKVSLSNLGSLVVDVNGNRLDATMVRENATTPDTFTLIKGTAAGNIPPTVSIGTPASNTAVASGNAVPLTATAGDVNGGTITQVTYYANGQLLGSSSAAPYTLNWAAPVGLHRITARATDNGNSVHLSSPIFVSVTSAFDVDGNGQVDALTDGLLALRYMFGLRGAPLTAGALGQGSYRDDVAMGAFFTASADFDVDGNNKVDALTDGLLVLRYLFGLRGAPLTNGALGQGATRNGAQIEAYLAARIP